MTAVAPTGQQRPTVRSVRRWARDNLFGGIGNSLLTIVASVVVVLALNQLIRFVFVTAQWDVIEANRRLLFIGRYPSGEEWRLWPSILLGSALAGLSVGLWSSIGWRGIGVIAALLAFVFAFFAHGTTGLLTGVCVALAVAGYLIAFFVVRESRWLGPGRQVAILGWLLTFPLTMTMLLAFGGVDPTLWGGFYLNVLIAVVAIIACLPLGILLALGRTSTFPVIRLACIGYIELIRGVPLVTILFMAWLVLPDFMPSWPVPVIASDGLDNMELVYRVMVAFTLFSAAYVAEAVRGGLEAVPAGQVEAAKALGLGTTRILGLIVLPQALRASIPALVGQFISLFKDTSLVFFVGGLVELLRAGRAIAQGQIQFSGREMEVLLFVALIFWIVAFSMSRASQRLEESLGVGER